MVFIKYRLPFSMVFKTILNTTSQVPIYHLNRVGGLNRIGTFQQFLQLFNLRSARSQKNVFFGYNYDMQVEFPKLPIVIYSTS